MDMITNYLNSLETYLPTNLKKDIRDELESSIYEQLDDKKEQLGRDLNDQEQEELLLNLGHPSRVAAGYLPNQQLVGKEYFPAYKKSLQIVLTIVLGLTLLITVPFMFPSENIVVSALSLFWNLFDNGATVFALITIIFYQMQKYEINLDEIYAWSPKDINENDPKLPISRLETFFELFFELLFLLWWNGLFNLPLTLSDNSIFTSVSPTMEWAAVYMPVNIIYAIGVVISFHKLVVAGWNYLSVISNMLLDVAFLIILYQISGFADFVIVNNTELQASSILNITAVVDNSIFIILGVFVLMTISDLWSNVKWLRSEGAHKR
ncbi:MAG: hypothetical protein GY808_16165 [Gammaproteobacteria bacterium]|nr:hypothetical protein [Gammaproteobacteria bacterium]